MLYISILVLGTKMGKIFGLEKKVCITKSILNRKRPGLCSVEEKKQRCVAPNHLLCTRPTFANGVNCQSGNNICELVFAHRCESLKFILDCALSEEAPYVL